MSNQSKSNFFADLIEKLIDVFTTHNFWTLFVAPFLLFIFVFILGESNLTLITDKAIIAFSGILASLIVSVVGFYFGTISNLYSTILKIEEKSHKNIDLMGLFDETIHSIRLNTFSGIFIYLAVIIINGFKIIDIPGITWFINSPHFTKSVVFNSLIIVGCYFLFLIATDILSGMFRLSKLFSIRIKTNIDGAKISRTDEIDHSDSTAGV